MSQIKFVTGPQITSGNLKNGDSLYGDIEEKVSALVTEGWEVVGTGPERIIIIHKGFIIELLRKIPIVNLVINFFFPLDTQMVISVILKK